MGVSVGQRAASDVAALWSTIATADRPANLTEYLERSAVAYSDRFVLDCFDSDRRLTYAALSDQARVAAGVLASHGVRAGDRVGVCLPNCPEIAVALLRARTTRRSDGQHQHATRGLGLRLHRDRQRVLDARDRAVVAGAPERLSDARRPARRHGAGQPRRCAGPDRLGSGHQRYVRRRRAGTGRRQCRGHDPVHLRQYRDAEGLRPFPPLLARARPGVGRPRARLADPRRRAVLLHGGPGEPGAGDVGRRNRAPAREAQPSTLHAVGARAFDRLGLGGGAAARRRAPPGRS